VAVVDHVEITEDELKLEAQTIQFKKQEYELKVRAIENLVSRKILEQAAGKDVSTEDFLKREVDDKIPEPTAGEVEGFYWGQKANFREPLEKVRDQAAQALKRAKIQDGRQALLLKLRQQAVVRILSEPPRLAVDAGKAPRRGPASAPVTIVEFADYQCPFCKQSEAVLDQLSAKYGDRLSFVLKDFPLPNIHPQAQAAAEAAHCAGEQGKYWQYHDALYAAPALIPEAYPEMAEQLQLDVPAFRACTASGKYKALVENNATEGQQLGVNSTPSFFVNGIAVTGAQPITAFETVINAELDRGTSRK